MLDLGSGGGIDVLLSARRAGPTGKAYGLDMTEEMLALAGANAKASGATNVEFLKGQIEDIPLPASTVDVIISNCVINLSTDKPAVFAEAYRVLRPGGRIGVTDVVAEDDLSPADRARRGSYVGCIAGALSMGEYRDEPEGRRVRRHRHSTDPRSGRRDALGHHQSDETGRRFAGRPPRRARQHGPRRRTRRAAGPGQAGTLISRSASRARTRRPISSRMGRTAATSSPAGSSSSQSS